MSQHICCVCVNVNRTSSYHRYINLFTVFIVFEKAEEYYIPYSWEHSFYNVLISQTKNKFFVRIVLFKDYSYLNISSLFNGILKV